MSTQLKVFREELKDPSILPEELALKAGLRALTYRSIERGKRTTYTTATKILNALNVERQSRGLEPVRLDDLGISVV